MCHSIPQKLPVNVLLFIQSCLEIPRSSAAAIARCLPPSFSPGVREVAAAALGTKGSLVITQNPKWRHVYHTKSKMEALLRRKIVDLHKGIPQIRPCIHQKLSGSEVVPRSSAAVVALCLSSFFPSGVREVAATALGMPYS